jgi:hypothetical protein
MLRHIAWFSEAPVEPSAEGDLTCTDDRVARRCLVPAREIEKLGVECSVFGNLRDADPVHVSKHLQKLNADIVVIGKITGNSLLKLARAAKHLGCYVVIDCGDYTDIVTMAAGIVEVADRFVAATPAIVELVSKQTGTPALFIPDCDDKSVGKNSPAAIAKLWIQCFKKLKLKPPACANTNEQEKK